jgi:hypothetical protein
MRKTKTVAEKHGVVTARRVQRFYAIMCELGMDDFIETVINVRRQALQNGKKARPATAADQKGGSDQEVNLTDDMVMEIESKVDVSRMIRVFGEGGDTFFDLVRVVTGKEGEAAEEVTIDELTDAFTFFAVASVRPIQMLLNYTRSI